MPSVPRLNWQHREVRGWLCLCLSCSAQAPLTSASEWVAYKEQKFVPHSLGDQESEVRMPQGRALVSALSTVADGGLCPLT